MLINKEQQEEYLADKSGYYQAGWESCLRGEYTLTISALLTRRELQDEAKREFDQGYGDCYANGESAPETFDYVKGI
jgi:hypothetical protein